MYADTHFPSIIAAQGHERSQIFVEKDMGFMRMYPLKTESYALSSLRDFSCAIGVPNTLKRDNAYTQVIKD